jgi:aerobic-type carbon monoxide dehydrogenase small subunit (CoxS/CutS family)
MKVCKVFNVFIIDNDADTKAVDAITEFLNELKEILSVTQSMSGLGKGFCGHLVVTIIGEK